MKKSNGQRGFISQALLIGFGALLLLGAYAGYKVQYPNIEESLGGTIETLPVFNLLGTKILPRSATHDFGFGSITATSSAPFSINISGDDANLLSSGSITFRGLKNCNTIDTDANGLLSCGTDTGGGGASALQIRDIPGSYDGTPASLSFNGGAFTLTASGSTDVTVKLDWGAGGPASLSENETITGNWINTANPWADNEVVDTLTINGGTVTWTDLTSYPTGCTNQFVVTIGDTLTCASVDISAMTNLAVTSPISLTGDVIGLSSNSLNFDEFQNPLVLDANITTTSGSFNWNFGGTDLFGIGYASISDKLEIGPNAAKVTDYTRVQFNDEDGNNSDWSMRVAGNGFPVVNLAKSKGTLASASAVVNGNTIGEIDFYGWKSGAFSRGAYINATVNGTPSGTIIPGRIGFFADSGVAEDQELLSLDTSAIEIGGTTPKIPITLTGSTSFNAGVSGSGLTDCDTAGSSKLLWDATSGKFSCGTDATGGGGGSGSLEVSERSVFQDIAVASLSFDPGAFNVSASDSASVYIQLDYTNGPASLSQDETIAGNWVNTTNPWADNEVIDALTVSGGVIGSNNISGTLTTTGTLTIGDNGDSIIFDASNWDISTLGKADFLSASVSTNFEAVGYVSASKYFGAGVNGAGDCNDANEAVNWTTTGLFACATVYTPGGTDVVLADGGTGASLVDPDVDRFFMWDDSAGATVLAGLGGKLAFTAVPTLTVASNSLSFGEFVASMSLDTYTEVVVGAQQYSINLSSTGDFRIEDNGATLFTILDTGALSHTGSATFSGGFAGSGLTDCDQATDTLNWDITSGKFSCGTDATGGGGVSSNSLDFDEFVNSMTVDAALTITGGSFPITFDHASVSGNFELTGDSSASRLGIRAGGAMDTALEVGGTVSASYGLFSGSLQVGGYSSQSFSAFGDSGTGHSLSSATDLLISGMLEVDGNSFFDLQLTVADKTFLNATASVASNFEVGDGAFRVFPDVSAPDTIFEVASTSGTTMFKIASSGHAVFDHDASPTVSSCGSGPSIVGNDNVGIVTAGTGGPTSCTVTFKKTWTTNAPVCMVFDKTSAARSLTISVTQSAFVISGAAFTSDVIEYLCVGYE